MPAINLLPSDPPVVPPSAPESAPSQSAPGSNGPVGPSAFGTVLSNAVNPPPADPPPAPAPLPASVAPSATAPPAASNAKTTSVADPPTRSPDPGADSKSTETSGQPAPGDPQLLPASSNAAAASVTQVHPQPAASVNDSKPKAASASPPAPSGSDGPPAQLVSALRLSDTLVSTVVDPATNAAAPRAKTDRGDAPTATDNQAPAANSPPALFAGLNLAGLNLVVNVPPASAAPAAILPPVAAAAQSTAHIPQAPSSPPVQHPPDATISAAPQNVAPSAVPPEVPATIIATAATATLELSSLAQTVSVSEKPASPVDARTTIPRAAIGDARLPAPADGGATVTQVAAVLPTNPDGSGYSPTPTQVDSQAAPLSTNQLPQQPTTTPIASGTAAVATALPQNPPATISVSSVPFSNTSAITVTSPIVTQAVLAAAPEKGSAAQPALGSDSVPSAPQPGTANPDLASFAAAPASLQAHAAIFQAVPPASAAGIHSAQVIEQVAYALQATHSSGQNMQLQLSPPDLGSLQISVSVHEGVLSARLEAQNPTTQQILVDNLSQLKNSLTQQGVAFDRIDVRLAGSQTGSGSSGTADSLFGQQQQNAFSWEQNPAFESTETDAPAPANPQSPGRFPRIAVTSLDVTV